MSLRVVNDVAGVNKDAEVGAGVAAWVIELKTSPNAAIAAVNASANHLRWEVLRNQG